MSKRRLGWRAATSACLVALVLAACSPAASTPAPSPSADYTGRSIQFAAVLSLTGAGEGLGTSQKRGIELAVETENKAGGVSGGKIAVDIQDDASTPKQSADIFQKLISETRAVGIIGPSLAIAAAAAHPVASGLKTPVIAPSLVGAGVVGTCAYACTHVFRDSVGEAAAVPDNVKTLAGRTHPRSAVIIYANDDTSSTAGATLFQQAFTDNGVQVPAGGTIQVAKAATTVTDVVTAAVALKADAWAISTPGPAAVLLMTEARKQGFKGAFVGGNSFNSAGVSKLGGDAAVGAQSATAYFTGLDTAANRAFVAAFRARYKDADGKPLDPDLQAAQAYSAVLLFTAAARSANLGFASPGPDRSSLERALSSVSADTPMGTVSFTLQNDVSQPIYVVAADGKGGFTLVQTYPPR